MAGRSAFSGGDQEASSCLTPQGTRLTLGREMDEITQKVILRQIPSVSGASLPETGVSAAEEGSLVFPPSFCPEEEDCRHVWDHRQQMCGIWQLRDGPRGAALIWSGAWSWLSTTLHHHTIAITGLHIAPLTVCHRLSVQPYCHHPCFPSSSTILREVTLGAELEGAVCPHPSAGGVLSRWLFSPCELLNSGNEKHIRAS